MKNFFQKIKNNFDQWVENRLSKALLDAKAKWDYYEVLVSRTRRGDLQALKERLDNVNYKKGGRK